jgi:hypothetical protein
VHDTAVRPFVPCQSVASPVGQLSADEAKVGACPVSAESVRDARTSGHRTPRTTMLCRAHGYNHLITVTSPTHEALEHGPSLLSLSLSPDRTHLHSCCVECIGYSIGSASRHGHNRQYGPTEIYDDAGIGISVVCDPLATS